MKKQNKVIKPRIVGGGTAIPLGNNFYFMSGRKHEQGGIDIGPDNKNGLEVEDGEVMQMGGKHVKVYSSLPILNGKSPAQLVMAGLNPDEVFNAQERFKDINKLNDDGSRKARFGTNRHFTINGNVMNKAGYVPSTGELPKANLGTVASVDKWVTRKDKDGRVARALESDIQKQIDTYNTSKKYRDAKSAEIREIKRRELETPIEIEKPSIIEKQDNTNIEKKSTNNTNKEKIAQNYDYRMYSNLAPAAESFNKTINEVKDDIKGFIDLGKNALYRTYDKIFKPEEKESSGINYSSINNDSSNNIVISEDNDGVVIPSYTQIPDVILGDRIAHPRNSNQYLVPENINLDSVNVGIRNRGEYPDINSEGAITTHMNAFTPWTNIEGVDLNKGYIGVDKNGKVKVGNYYDFDENYMINRAAMNKTKGFVLDDNGNIVFENDKGKPLSKKWSPNLDRALIEYQKEDGTWGVGPSNITAYEGTNNSKTYGAMTGGRMIIKVGDETRLVSGSVKDINNAIQDMKNRHGVEYVEAYSLDNGTYNHAIRTKNKRITKDDWIEYDNRNKGGGHVLYLKRFGGMSRRQKAEGGKNILSPRGLGIQGNSIVRGNRSGSAGSGGGVSGGRRTVVKPEPLKLLTSKVKPLTVNPIKPPTKITVNTPKTETKNKGTWWRDNGSDLISGLAKGGASLASYLINRNMLNDLKYSGQPIFTPAAKLKTKININPQIDAVNRTIAARNKVAEESASSKVRNSRMNANYIDRLGYLNELYGMKENKETELINADKLNQQEITKGNIQAYNDWAEKKQNFENTVREKQSENAVSFVSNLASGVDDILTNRQKRKQFKQNVAAYIASHPNVSPELLESYGLDIFDHKTTNSNKSEVKTSKSKGYRNTGMTEEEYGKWLKETDFDKYIVWNNARTEKERNAKVRAAKREKGKI